MNYPKRKDRAADPMKRAPASNDELPAEDGHRWTLRRKAAVVAAVSAGELTIDEACHRYRMSLDEFGAWDRALRNFGIIGRG